MTLSSLQVSLFASQITVKSNRLVFAFREGEPVPEIKTRIEAQEDLQISPQAKVDPMNDETGTLKKNNDKGKIDDKFVFNHYRMFGDVKIVSELQNARSLADKLSLWNIKREQSGDGENAWIIHSIFESFPGLLNAVCKQELNIVFEKICRYAIEKLKIEREKIRGNIVSCVTNLAELDEINKNTNLAEVAGIVLENLKGMDKSIQNGKAGSGFYAEPISKLFHFDRWGKPDNYSIIEEIEKCISKKSTLKPFKRKQLEKLLTEVISSSKNPVCCEEDKDINDKVNTEAIKEILKHL